MVFENFRFRKTLESKVRNSSDHEMLKMLNVILILIAIRFVSTPKLFTLPDLFHLNSARDNQIFTLGVPVAIIRFASSMTTQTGWLCGLCPCQHCIRLVNDYANRVAVWSVSLPALYPISQ